MIKHFLLLAFAILWGTMPALAEDAAKPLTITVPRIATKHELCQTLKPHKPLSDVNYQPGVDVYGNPVVPADLHQDPNLGVPDPVVIPIEVNLLENLNILTNVGGLNLDSEVGTIKVYRNGKIDYNGQKIEGQIEVLCSDGQLPKDGVKSGLDGLTQTPARNTPIDGQYPPEE